MFEDEELDEMEDVLIYDEDAIDVWDGLFDIGTPQDIADTFDRPVLVKSTGKIYKKNKN